MKTLIHMQSICELSYRPSVVVEYFSIGINPFSVIGLWVGVLGGDCNKKKHSNENLSSNPFHIPSLWYIMHTHYGCLDT